MVALNSLVHFSIPVSDVARTVMLPSLASGWAAR